jgi:hypothetical protein
VRAVSTSGLAYTVRAPFWSCASTHAFFRPNLIAV